MDFKRMFAGIVFVAVAMTAAFTAQAQQAPAAGAPAQGAPAQGGGGRGPGRGPQGPPLTLTSPAFTDLQLLPAKYGCAGGNNISFPLAWANAPAATQSFAVVVSDIDLRQARGHVAPSHWVLWNIPPTTTSLPEGIPAVPELPDGSRQTITAGRGGAPGTGFRAMCPPPPTVHHYAIELYALDIKLDTLATGASVTDLYAAIDGHVIGHQIMVVPFHQ
ncbi:MAG TPA: YbhB/YbcL family Raf kinase inhibitor-like protein [Vicinamibacterales bacterium]|nr:YbhB/YbcL family Raf kinase inhibitor-like protein [Vicinamibacterales bacterium]